jgi:hypothetical protein
LRFIPSVSYGGSAFTIGVAAHCATDLLRHRIESTLLRRGGLIDEESTTKPGWFSKLASSPMEVGMAESDF